LARASEGLTGIPTPTKLTAPILAIARTRAKNRTISYLIGLGEVSAEEIEADVTDPARPAQENKPYCEKCHVTYASLDSYGKHISSAHNGKI
jgi:hypothetical protein